MRRERFYFSLLTSNFSLNLGGGERVRTDDPLRARQVLSQLSYTPDKTVISFEFSVFSFKRF